MESESDLKKAIHECLKALEYAGEGDYTDIRHELINLLRRYFSLNHFIQFPSVNLGGTFLLCVLGCLRGQAAYTSG